MGRMTKIFICLALCCLLPLTALAANSVTRLQNVSAVNAEGTCTVSLSLTVHMETQTEGLTFPVPEKAQSVLVNGSSVRTRKNGSVQEVDISGCVPGIGDYPVTISYTLPGVVEAGEEDTAVLTLPLLSGFAYPISNMEFTVTLPGEVTARPGFSSSYYRESIESSLSFSVNGATVSGVMNTTLKDHESLTMTLTVPAEQFPSVRPEGDSIPISQILTYVCLALAAVYWLLALRCLPVVASPRATPPDGLTAGDLGSHLTMTGTDLTMMVVSWAQLGYLLMQMDDNGRVLLHKRMDMGNERSAFENKCFRALFGKKRMVDGSGYHYAQLCRKVAKTPPKVHGMFKRRSGNFRLFRVLSAAAAGFAGMSIGGAFSDSEILGPVLMILLGAGGYASGLVIQSACQKLHLRRRGELRLAVILTVLWLILGTWSGLPRMGAVLAGSQILAGLAGAYGGRRSDLGKQVMQQILGLRRYLKTVSREELRQRQRRDPDYFYKMAPYALALGVDQAFALRFGNMDLPECAYLVTRMGASMTASEWAGLLRDAVDALDERQRQLTWEHLMGK